MVRRVFFSFHFQRDHWRVNQVRMSWVTQDREAAGYEDASDWEEIKRQSEEEVKAWIDDQLHGTSVTAVLIGNETAGREYVEYEIEESVRRGNGIVGIRVHRLKDKSGNDDFSGTNPLDNFAVESENGEMQLSDIFETYDWKSDNGRENFGQWVEEAKQNADDLSNKERRTVRKPAEEDEGVSLGEIIAGGVGIGLIIAGLNRGSQNDGQDDNETNSGPETSKHVQDHIGSNDLAEDVQDAVSSGGLDPGLPGDDSDDDGLL